MKHLGAGFVMMDYSQHMFDQAINQYYIDERKRQEKRNRAFNIFRIGVGWLVAGLAFTVVNKLDQSNKE